MIGVWIRGRSVLIEHRAHTESVERARLGRASSPARVHPSTSHGNNHLIKNLHIRLLETSARARVGKIEMTRRWKPTLLLLKEEEKTNQQHHQEQQQQKKKKGIKGLK